MNSAQYQANATLTLGASFRPDSPLGDMMARDNAFNYITAGSSAVVADDIARGLGKVAQLIRGTPTTTAAVNPAVTSSSDDMSRYYTSTRATQVQQNWPQSQSEATRITESIGNQINNALAPTVDGEIRALNQTTFWPRYLESWGRIFGE
jgi:hypothetical protein